MNRSQREVFHLIIGLGEMRSTIAGTYGSRENAQESLVTLERVNPKVAGKAYIAQGTMPKTFICDDDVDDEDIFEDD